MKVKVIAEIHNTDGVIPGMYEVARLVDGELWHYGIYESETRAKYVAKEIGNGVVLEVSDETY